MRLLDEASFEEICDEIYKREFGTVIISNHQRQNNLKNFLKPKNYNEPSLLEEGKTRFSIEAAHLHKSDVLYMLEIAIERIQNAINS